MVAAPVCTVWEAMALAGHRQAAAPEDRRVVLEARETRGAVAGMEVALVAAEVVLTLMAQSAAAVREELFG